MSFPVCSDELSASFDDQLRALGAAWARHAHRPRIAEAVLQAWDAMIESWIVEPEAPLLVRKSAKDRGSIVTHVSGRSLVPTDNSPAQWVFAVAHLGVKPSLEEALAMLRQGELPVAMMFQTIERATAIFTGARGGSDSTSEAGWKLAHIKPVGLGRVSIATMRMRRLEEHFRLLMSPRNMFVVPAGWSGLAEVAPFIDGFVTARGGNG